MRAAIAQLVERIHGKDEVSGSSPDRGSTIRLFSEIERECALFSLVARSANQMFSWGEWDFGSLEATAFLFLSLRFNPKISSNNDFLAFWSMAVV